MSALLLLVFCLALGVLVARVIRPPATLPQGLNWWVINIAFSALVLHLIPTLRFDWQYWFLVAALWLVFLGAWVVFAMLGRALHWSRARIGAVTLACGLGNTAFIGFPMIEALHGREGAQLAVVADQLGTFIALAVGGTILAAIYSGKNANAVQVTRKVLQFPRSYRSSSASSQACSAAGRNRSTPSSSASARRLRRSRCSPSACNSACSFSPARRQPCCSRSAGSWRSHRSWSGWAVLQ